MVDVLTAVVIIAVATAVPEVRRALGAARRKIDRPGQRDVGAGTADANIVNPGPSSQFPITGPQA